MAEQTETLFASLSTAQWGLAAGIILVSFVVRGMAGFGSGLIAIPLLALMLPLWVVVPVLTALDLTGAAIHGIGQRLSIAWREILHLALPMLLGIVSGYLVFKSADTDALKMGLGIFVWLYSIYVLSDYHAEQPHSAWWALPLGWAGGFISTLYGTGGPFYVIYLSMRGLDKHEFRATVAAVFVFEASTRLVGYALGGMFEMQAIWLVAAAMPFLALGMYLGERAHTTVAPKTFARAIAVLLIFSGAALVFS